VDGYAGVHRDFAPFWKVEMEVAKQRASEGGRKEGLKSAGRGWFRERVRKMEAKVSTRLSVSFILGILAADVGLLVI